MVNALLATGQLKAGQEYDFDFDHQFIETEKYDAKPTCKTFLGYCPGVAIIGDVIVGIKTEIAIPTCALTRKRLWKVALWVGGFCV